MTTLFEVLRALDEPCTGPLVVSELIYPREALELAAGRLGMTCQVERLPSGRGLVLRVQPPARLDELLNEALVEAVARC